MEEPRIIDLFAGIGGIRIAYERYGARCVFSSEKDKFARRTYRAYFGDEHEINEDITEISPQDVPDHDILLAGFPCQPFSLAGVSKKASLGRQHGFDDPTQGTLFFNIKRILEDKQPESFLLENVKNLRAHDGGKTWGVIEESLVSAGYTISDRVLDAVDILPQHRERVFIVGFRGDGAIDWGRFWTAVEENMRHHRRSQRMYYGSPEDQWPRVGAVLTPDADVPAKYTLSERMFSCLQRHKARHAAKGNGFGYGLVTRDDEHTRTLKARYYKDGSEILIHRGEGALPRKLTPMECARLQGFPADFVSMMDDRQDQPVSNTQAYKQLGNSVCVPVVSAIAQAHIPLV